MHYNYFIKYICKSDRTRVTVWVRILMGMQHEKNPIAAMCYTAKLEI